MGTQNGKTVWRPKLAASFFSRISKLHTEIARMGIFTKLAIGTVTTGTGLLLLATQIDDPKKRFLTLVPAASAFSTADHGLHAPHFDWSHRALLKTYDHASLRRGYQVCGWIYI